MAEGFKFEGFNECLKKIKALETEMPANGFRRALRSGSKVLAAALRGRAPDRTGMTLSAIKPKPSRRRKNYLGMLIGLFGENFGRVAFYAGFVEYGWRAGKRFGRRAGEERGSKSQRRIPGTHWAEKGFADSRDAALAAATATLTEEIEKLAKK